MGSRSRSVRLRMYFLVAIPLIAMAGLLAYVAGISVRNAINLDRAPNLIDATSLPTAVFTDYLQAERAAAVSYLFQPSPANLATYDTAIATTSQHVPAFRAAMTSPATVSSETTDEAKAIDTALDSLNQLKTVRAAVTARAITPIVALADYSQGIAVEPALFQAETNSETDAGAVGQAVGLIATVQAREALSQEWALLGGMLAGNRMTRADRATITQDAATRQADLHFAQSILTPANLATYDAAQNGSAAAQAQLAAVEQALAAGTDVSQVPATATGWQQTTSTLLQDSYRGGVALAQAELVSDHQFGRSAWTRVAVTSGIALGGLLVTIVMTTLVARGIIRRLRGLERSALTLAEQQLPDVIARLRRGEDVDVAHEAPPLQSGGSGSPKTRIPDEIGRVGQSFDLVRQAAIGSAVEEARLRRGLNDVFRSLARRSQSLLHRQLTLLDQMERRATDPEALDDLFRLDHLTTRMRRHAEGLVILAGAPPSRGWNSPVRMVDVMRGAIAEVEDYARVTVATRSQAALSGAAVADVIHLLAELIENATTLSPPYTSVRVTGDTVANGFAIEVEDRGLGMSPERRAEFNARLARPPEFNPADSEQLGLFVVSQLARRHSIQVTLQVSPYGGITAVALIPPHLVVTEAAFRPGQLGPPMVIGMTPGELPGPGPGPGPAGPRARPGLPPAPGIRISGPLRHAQDTTPEIILGPDPAEQGFDVFLPRRRGQAPASALEPEPLKPELLAPEAPEQGAPERAAPEQGVPEQRVFEPGAYLASPPYPVDSPAPYPHPPGSPVTPMIPVASPPGAPGDDPEAFAGPGDDLPRRVRQASLAPQLRGQPAPRRETPASRAAASERTPADIRQSLSALQRGWQDGRAKHAASPASGEPPEGTTDAPTHGGTDGA